MRRSRTTERAESESRSVLDRVRGRSGERTDDESTSLFDRARGSSTERADESSGLFDRARGSSKARSDDESGSLFDRARAKYGLGALLVVAGIVLFLFPEPITSTVGIALIGAGVLVWLVGRFR